MMDYDFKQEYKELDYRFVKEIESETNAKAWHVRIDKIDYRVVTAPFRRACDILTAYTATRYGNPKGANPLFMEDGDDLNEGVRLLLIKLGKLTENDKGSPVDT